MGCQFSHFDAGELPKPCGNLSIKLKKSQDPGTQKPQGVYSQSLYIKDPHFSRPVATQIRHAPTIENEISATLKRFACDMPLGVVEERRLFVKFSKLLLERIMPPLMDIDVRTIDHALEKAAYSSARKAQLRQIRRDFAENSKDAFEVLSFLKKEGYMKAKHARGINSPSDLSKILLLALWQAVDKLTFENLPNSIKHTRPEERCEIMEQMLGEEAVAETDFSSMEAHHEREFIDLVHFWFEHMTKNLSGFNFQKLLTKKLMLGRHKIVFQHILVGLDERLMSGALWTSSSNTILNYCLMVYLHVRSTTNSNNMEDWLQAAKTYRGLVEGDDGISVATKAQKPIHDDLIRKLGLRLVMDYHNHFSEANFCGMSCDPNLKAVVKDPVEVLCKMFVLPPRYKNASEKTKKALLRGRALSYKHLFRDVPIVGPLCDHILYHTRSFTPRFDDDLIPYNLRGTRISNRYPESNVNENTRVLVQDLFKVSPKEQHDIESCFLRESPTIICDIKHLLPKDVLEYGIMFHTRTPAEFTAPPTEYPPELIRIRENGLKQQYFGKRAQAVEAQLEKVAFIDYTDPGVA